MNGISRLFFLIILFNCLWASGGVNSGSERVVVLEWKIPSAEFFEESTFIPSLYFHNAVFTDSLPQVPVYIYRARNDTPHFVNKFKFDEISIIQCTPEEIRILEEAGFKSESFIFSEEIEYSAGSTYSRFHLIPVRKREGIFEKLKSFSISSQREFAPRVKLSTMQNYNYPGSSVLATGEWYRICVERDGIYRITSQNLLELGINPAQLEKSTIQLFGNGGGMLPERNSLFRYTDLQENSIWVSGGNTGQFSSSDYILFYGQSPHRWEYSSTEGIFKHQVHYYSNETCYFLTFGREGGKRVQPRASLPDNHTHTVATFHDYAFHQRELVNILGSGKRWFGETFEGGAPQHFTFNFPGINRQHQAHIRVYAAARSSATSSFTIQALNQTRTLTIGSINPANYTGVYARDATSNITALPDDDRIIVSLNYNRPVSGAKGWLGFIAINARRNLTMASDQLFFRDPTVIGTNNIGRFAISGASQRLRVWDVTNPFDIKQQQFDLDGDTAIFKIRNNELLEFAAFNDQNFLTPLLKGKVPNQDLHASQVHDLIIVVPDIFRPEAERLANFRRTHDGLSVLLVTPQQIYNEFSSGVPDISAIRNFMKMFHDRAPETGRYPRYLLLFGNGTYDNKNVLGLGGNLIPTFQTLQSLNFSTTYISDDFFGLLDHNEGFDAIGSLDLGIGRLPVRTQDEARFVVDKLLRYNQRIDGLEPGTTDPRFAGTISNFADWRNIISIIADDEDGNIHQDQSEILAGFLSENHPVYNLEKIYLDAYEQQTLAGGSRYPDVNRDINNRLNQGALLINYIGHGGVKGLAHERILTFNDILSWSNFYNLPIFITATCEFSSFDQPDPNDRSAGVRVFLKPDGGAIALFTTTRLAYSHSNFTLNDAFMRNAFIPLENGEMPRLGDLMRKAKVESGSNIFLKNFVLLGDPSMKMAYPKLRAITTSWPETMRALEKVTFEGIIVNRDGTPNETYNGVLYPTVYDKKATFQTLGNDSGSTPRNFQMQNRALFKGTTKIENGKFSFSFVVPRDISYASGAGKISYYFDDGKTYDGHGYFNDFFISGTADDFLSDHAGPEISLFINNTTFASGGKTGPNPILIANLSDESGINITGQIGHNIVAFLNGNTAYPFFLNNFYRAELDSHTAGRVVFPFFNLEKGDYTLTLRAWDVHNNPSTESIDFIVTSATEITISDLINYPNPFSDKTTFSFRHNKPATELNIRIDIYSLNGQLVKTIDNMVYASGFEVPVEWDGTDNGGTLLRNGIYLFRVAVSTDQGDQAVKSERLVIFR